MKKCRNTGREMLENYTNTEMQKRENAKFPKCEVWEKEKGRSSEMKKCRITETKK